MSKGKGDLSKSVDENKVESGSADHPHIRREKWIKSVQQNKEKYAKRATINEAPTSSQGLKESTNNVKSQSQAPRKKSSFFEKRRSAPAAIGRAATRKASRSPAPRHCATHRMRR